MEINDFHKMLFEDFPLFLPTSPPFSDGQIDEFQCQHCGIHKELDDETWYACPYAIFHGSIKSGSCQLGDQSSVFLHNWHWLKMRSKIAALLQAASWGWGDQYYPQRMIQWEKLGTLYLTLYISIIFFPSPYLVISSTIKFHASKIYFRILGCYTHTHISNS